MWVLGAIKLSNRQIGLASLPRQSVLDCKRYNLLLKVYSPFLGNSQKIIDISVYSAITSITKATSVKGITTSHNPPR